MIVKPVLPVVTRLIAVLLPVLADLIAALLPILPHLVPVALLAGAILAGKSLVKSVAALFRRPVGGELAGAWPAVAQSRQCAWAVADAASQAGARYGARTGGRQG